METNQKLLKRIFIFRAYSSPKNGNYRESTLPEMDSPQLYPNPLQIVWYKIFVLCLTSWTWNRDDVEILDEIFFGSCLFLWMLDWLGGLSSEPFWRLVIESNRLPWSLALRESSEREIVASKTLWLNSKLNSKINLSVWPQVWTCHVLIVLMLFHDFFFHCLKKM